MHPPRGGAQKINLPGVRHVIAVASGKGGVGKSTVAANLALALKSKGSHVGLMDSDIYGPSVPIMMGVQDVNPQTTAFPIERYGISCRWLIVPPGQAVIWRPMVHGGDMLLTDIAWGELGLPKSICLPGTGDAQLTYNVRRHRARSS